ncbi:MAG: NCS2 family permease [Clostridia bacterium]|nr:NCS2 family permease [Clostridia bacterium]
MDKFFKLSENNTTVKTEIAAGLTTFMTMAYILAVNPNILGSTGMNPHAVLIATCIASMIGCFLMGFLANLPIALSAAMGLNAFFAYTVVGNMGVAWETALLAVFCEGVIFILLSVTRVREAIFNAIPLPLKDSVSVGIGLFIAFIGLQNAGLCVDSSTLVTITDFRTDFNTHGICAVLAAVGLFVIAILWVKNVKGSILIGIIVTWLLGMICQLTGIYVVDEANGFYSLFPAGIISLDFSSLGDTFGQCFTVGIDGTTILNFIVVIFSFLFVDMFDTIGTLIGVCSRAGFLDENGHLPQIRPALLSDAIATTCGSILGTSTTSAYVESSAGAAQGGRTGLTAITVGVLFALAAFFSPIFTAVPAFATAPALIVVGFLMFESIREIGFGRGTYTDSIPCYLCIIAMPLFYSISEGIAIGVISYVIINLVCGEHKKITPLMYILAGLFICKYIFL